ncbi:hypothetical protein [Agrobacterium tumefaciens]|uniref:hypothetical protein n=1 Tax=Agrobacterium tumefaciens TaxID=358 RepID=UPI002780E1A4|nr:hypothetical protein [Agrobacterium tumefaciens]MDP9875260.1 hypothetical protein [Agrobacterium tumefaciens]MDP9980351.1 hypothetical protein [Agrobacterium tumefaciens]
MKSTTAAQIRKEEARKSKKAADWFRRWLEDRRRQNATRARPPQKMAVAPLTDDVRLEASPGVFHFAGTGRDSGEGTAAKEI